MLIPEEFAEASVHELMEAAAKGHAGMDLRWLDAILAHGDAAVPDLVQFGLEDRPDDVVDLDEALALLFRHFRSPQSIPWFVEYLRNHDEVTEEIVPAIQAIGKPALEPLIELYGDMEEDRAGDVAFCLAALRIPDERVLEVLTDRLEYDLTEGAISLGLYGDAAARPALERVLTEEQDAHLKGLIEDAMAQLGRGPDEEDAFDIRSFFEDKVPPPADVLEEQELVEMLQSADPEYRFTAAAGLIQSAESEETIEALLEHARTDSDPRVRAKCWEALAEFAEDESVYQAMLERLQDVSAPKIERAGALVGLGQRSGEPEIRKYAEEFYQDPETRAAALGSMWNSLDRSFAFYFPDHLEDPDAEIRKQAISGVGYLGIYDAAERLRKMFENEDFRPNALFAYALCARAEVSPARMRSLLRRIEELAGGLDEDENHLVELALDERLILHGHKPIFHPEESDQAPEKTSDPFATAGRNDPCPCGSGKKFKKCHGA